MIRGSGRYLRYETVQKHGMRPKDAKVVLTFAIATAGKKKQTMTAVLN